MELNAKRPVLDHGYVQYIDHLGNDLSPLEAARMSTGKETGVDPVKDDALRLRLWRDNHTSPFEQCELVVEIQCPIFVLRQIDRHRTVDYDGTVIESEDENPRQFMSRNEFSGRYATMPDLFFIPDVDRIQKKGAANKQGSAGALDRDDQEAVRESILNGTQIARRSYEWMVDKNVASEIARVALPLNQYTKLRLKGSLLTWLKFLNLRLRLDVQLECRVYAQEIAKVVRRLFPKTWKIFEDETLYAIKLNVGDRMALTKILMEQVPGIDGMKSWARLTHQPTQALVPDGD